MKIKKLEVNFFNGMLSETEEHVYTREKHFDNLDIRNIWSSNCPTETTDEVTFPISADLLFTRYSSGNGIYEFFIKRIQNGKEEIIYDINEYRENTTWEDEQKSQDKFEELISGFAKKGFFQVA